MIVLISLLRPWECISVGFVMHCCISTSSTQVVCVPSCLLLYVIFSWLKHDPVTVRDMVQYQSFIPAYPKHCSKSCTHPNSSGFISIINTNKYHYFSGNWLFYLCCGYLFGSHAMIVDPSLRRGFGFTPTPSRQLWCKRLRITGAWNAGNLRDCHLEWMATITTSPLTPWRTMCPISCSLDLLGDEMYEPEMLKPS